MEYNFSITTKQIKKLSGIICAKQIEGNARLHLSLNKAFLTALFFWAPILAPTLFFYFILKEKTPDTFVITTICAALYFVIWKTILKKKIKLSAPAFKFQTNTLDRAIEKANYRRLSPLKGNHTAIILPTELTLIRPEKNLTTISWKKLCNVTHDDDFIYLTVRKIFLFKRTHLIAKSHTRDRADDLDSTSESILFKINTYRNPKNSSK